MEEEDTDKQRENSGRLNVLPHQWKKGQSGNPLGRPKGKTMKEYAKELLACQTDEERQAFLNGIPKDKIWEMAEGKAEAKTDVTSNGESIVPILVKFIDGQTAQTIKDDRDTTGV